MTMVNRSRKRSFAMSLAKTSLLLLTLPFGSEAFSSSSPFLSTRPNVTPTVRHAATLESNASEASELRPANPSPSPVATAVIASDATSSSLPADAIQSRSLDRDAIINSSVLLLAVGIVLEHVLSVDVGITRGWTAAEIAERVPIDNWRSYTDVLNMAPLRTKALTSGAVYAIGDVIAQSRQEEEGEGTYSMLGKLDRWRVLRSLAAGLIGHGPMSHVWYRVSEDFFDNVMHLHAWWDFVPKVIVDQTVFGPVWNNSYILLLGLMQLHTPSRIWEDMKRTTIPLILSGLRLWPFVHCITYGLIPVENRLLWVDAVEIVWVTILASEASSPSGDEEGYDSALAVDRKEDDGIR